MGEALEAATRKPPLIYSIRFHTLSKNVVDIFATVFEIFNRQSFTLSLGGARLFSLFIHNIFYLSIFIFFPY